ncbi:MAG: triphosphoribosyl-dephospho-CoA synthase CitG [Peptococcaceae bacterium]|nr:triphosphoribosyl-dephospho-CoA synthase CitG [Peptococcaceae bacterium]
MRNRLVSINREDQAYQIGSFAIQAMIYEVSCFPTPGLVSPVSNGAHKDMNYYTFIDSTCALIRYFIEFARLGLSGISGVQLFERIRTVGLIAEEEMFRKTKGVNTHKGMLFLLGICCAAVGKCIGEKRRFEDTPKIIREMTAGLVDKELVRLQKKEKLSYGEKLYSQYKIEGIRGEVEKGIPTVFDYSLKLYTECSELSINDRLVHTLLGIMQICEDTNIVHRHSLLTLKTVQARAKEIMMAGGMKTEKGRKMIEDLQNEFILENISPGGSADLLGITVFLSLVRDWYFAEM